MYRRMYGLPKNHGLVFAVSPRPYTSPTKPSNRPVQPKSLTTLLNSSDSSTSGSGPKKYRCCNRRRPPAAFRDSSVWAKLLDEENLGKLRELEAEREKAEPAPLAEEAEIECLLVKDIQLHIKENAESHHTDLFESTDRDLDPQLVVRRGQEFKLTLSFQRPWSSKDDDMNLIFKIGDAPNPNKGTFVSMKLEEGKDTSYMTSENKEWGARILEQTGNSLTLGVYPPPDVIVGEWEYAVRTVKVKDEEVEEYDCEGSEEVIILLNPWCKDDDVYMENNDELKEYISNQIGLVFCGSYHSIQSKPWFYDQFLEGMLEASLHLLRKANDFTITSKMGDPVYIARALSRILNNLDDFGVLEGRWDGEYEDGTRPLSWMGSAPILEQYMDTGLPVKYGQCWVFSHVFTTVARALGLPCRSVTNFSSAHDTNLTMTIDKYVDDEGDELGHKNDDSVWNFHVWNEVWIRRPDLDKLTGQKGKYDGWHAVDATPQELSDSVFQCGPSPLVAIKEGDVHIGHDTKFIFGEVNAEYCTWRDGFPPKLISKNSHRVGKKISTKWPNGTAVTYYTGVDEGIRLDVTDLYKYPEGSVAEREVVEKATRTGSLGFFLFKNESGVQISIDDLEQRLRVGQDVTVKVTVKNVTSEPRSLSLRTTVRPINYWGGLRGKERVASQVYDEDTFQPDESKTYDLLVRADDILRLCDESLSMKILALCWVQGFSEPVFESDELVIKTPGIRCTAASEKVSVQEPVEVEMTLKNPLATEKLTRCQLKIQGTMEVDDQRFTKKHACYTANLDDLQPGEVRSVKVKVKPTRLPTKSQEREMNVGLVTRELPDFVGNLHFEL